MPAKTKQEIIQETRDFYAADPKRRAENQLGNCFYETEDGRNCGVGRCMISNSVIEVCNHQGKMNEISPAVQNIQNLEEILKEEYRGHDCFFWGDIQLFHDRGDFWNENGISKAGEKHFQYLMEKYK